VLGVEHVTLPRVARPALGMVRPNSAAAAEEEEHGGCDGRA
jgi:hypothetical protein